MDKLKHEDPWAIDAGRLRVERLPARRGSSSVRLIEPAVLGDALADWTERDGPVYLRLSCAIADAIAQGQVDLNARLPAERVLAAHLRVARGTVVAAYDALRAQGVVQTRRGSGTMVHGRATMARAHRAPQLSRLVEPHGAAIDLALAAPHVSAEDLPDLTLSLRKASGLLGGHGYAPLGAPALREILAGRFRARGVPTEADQILITSGGQSALSLVAAALLNAGDQVLTESPTYPAALEVFVRTGARVDAIRRDHAGPLIHDLEQATARRPPRIVYLIPTCHNPTGSVMSEGRRLAIVRRIQTTRTLLVEDAVLEDLLLDGPAPTPLAALAPSRVITIGSLSKTVWGGLRVGWIRAPADLVLRIGRVKASLELGSSGLEQLAAIAAFERYDDALLDRRRDLVRHRLEILCEELSGQLPEWQFAQPRGGLSVWAQLPVGSADHLAQLALRRGVAISSGRTASPGEEFRDHVRLCAGPPPAQIREGVRRTAEAWQELVTARAQLSAPPKAKAAPS